MHRQARVKHNFDHEKWVAFNKQTWAYIDLL